VAICWRTVGTGSESCTNHGERRAIRGVALGVGDQSLYRKLEPVARGRVRANGTDEAVKRSELVSVRSASIFSWKTSRSTRTPFGVDTLESSTGSLVLKMAY
jgi:hypothetical protein